MMDEPLTLPSGIVVRVRNLVLFEGGATRALTVYVQMPVSLSDRDVSMRAAHEIADLHLETANQQGITAIIIAVCRTQDCLELRGPPAQQFSFTRTTDGRWVAERQDPRI